MSGIYHPSHVQQPERLRLLQTVEDYSSSDSTATTSPGPSRKKGWVHYASTDPVTPSPSSISSAEPTSRHLKGFKYLAQAYGLGIRRRDSVSSPMTKGLIDVIPDEEQDAPHSFSTAPLTPSSYKRRLSLMSTTNAQWGMNYREAAIYLEEGENNEEFCTHPKRAESLPAYMLAHTKWFHTLDLFVSILILCLTMNEPPTLPSLEISVQYCAIIELIFLTIIVLGIIIKVRWLGFQRTMEHHRTLFKTIVLTVMITEAIIIIIRNESHFRISRALRPVFLLDNRHLRGVRRFFREILQCLPPIFDMLILLFFFIIIFTLLGHFLFGHDDNDPFFRTLEDSFVNLFVLLTTANYPDIMMPALYKSRWNVLFFVAYLVVVLYFFMNLLLAVVYDHFSSFEKEKFRKLLLHRRKACHNAFHLLLSRANTHGIIFRHFFGMMMVYQPEKSLRDIYLMFRALDKSQDGFLNREEFCHFFEMSNLIWKPLLITPPRPWPFLKTFGLKVLKFLDSKTSDYAINVLVIFNTIILLARWIDDQPTGNSWDSILFAVLFAVEMSVKLLTWGKHKIFCSGWHTFDLISTIAYVGSLVFISFVPTWSNITKFVRPLRLLRLFKMKKRYRNVLGTLFILYRPLLSASTIMLLLYYFYAILGIEIFRDVDLRNCCNGTLIEGYYTVPTDEKSFALRFYMNAFDNIFNSFVTLFELTVVNNWYVIMEGHVIVTSRYSRIYFISFYLTTMILLDIIVAFILDTFLFRMRYKRTIDKTAEEKLLRTEIFLNTDEINFCYHQYFQDKIQRKKILEEYGEDLNRNHGITYVGRGKRTKEILFKRVCKDEVSNWIRESEEAMLNSPQSHYLIN